MTTGSSVNGQATHDELARIDLAYRELQRRDGAAWWHATCWRRFALLLAVGILVSTGFNVYQARQASQVQAFVQPVQITEEGQMILVGVPQDLLAYQPTDAAFMDMLGPWTMKRRWRGDEDNMKRTYHDYDWLYRHTCGAASEQLKKEVETLGLLKPTKLRTSVDIKAVLKTETPTSFQVNFHEVVRDHAAATLVERDWIGTFTVGRVKPKTLAEAKDNRLGICVNGYGFAPVAKPGT